MLAGPPVLLPRQYDSEGVTGSVTVVPMPSQVSTSPCWTSKPMASRAVLRDASWAAASFGSVGSWPPGGRVPVVICSRRSSAICLYLASAT